MCVWEFQSRLLMMTRAPAGRAHQALRWQECSPVLSSSADVADDGEVSLLPAVAGGRLWPALLLS
ncbi:hypothetical protein B7P34_33240 [Streptosporangium nondiastaticum]|uniref:Uncharacterized protein n=1 Tax=Streptosporangium nondiastaticum TaxID=35764 RepID=A0A9X7PE25_9ACTN|nr:hypothetical protein B7P34_33240 [Streptosporangium nondiastaticum]